MMNMRRLFAALPCECGSEYLRQTSAGGALQHIPRKSRGRHSAPARVQRERGSTPRRGAIHP